MPKQVCDCSQLCCNMLMCCDIATTKVRMLREATTFRWHSLWSALHTTRSKGGGRQQQQQVKQQQQQCTLCGMVIVNATYSYADFEHVENTIFDNNNDNKTTKTTTIPLVSLTRH